MKPHPLLVCAALVALAVTARTACGNDMFRNAPDVKIGKDDPVMSMATLRTCVALEYEIRDLRRDSKSAWVSLETARGSLRGADQLVAAAKATLDQRDARSVDDYNRKLAEQRQLRDDYNARIAPYNAMRDRLVAAGGEFNRDCTAPYREADRLKVLGEREEETRKRMEADKAGATRR